MKNQKTSLTRSFVLRITLIFLGIALFLTLFYRWGFPTYYYWKLEQPVKEAQKQIQQGKTPTSSEIVFVSLPKKEYSSEEEATEALDFQLTKEGISLNRFWVDRTTLQAVEKGKAVQRLYSQTKQKSDFYTRFFSKGDTLYLVGSSIPAFQSAVHTLLPILIAATFLFLLLVFGSVVFLVRTQIIRPISLLEGRTRKISSLDFDDETKTTIENELGSLDRSITRMTYSLQQHEQEMSMRHARAKNFSANLAHELKTPLSVMRLLVDGEEMGLENPAFLQDMDGQLTTMDELVTNLLAYSQQMNADLSFALISIQQVVESESAQQQLIDPQFTITLDIAEENVYSNEQWLAILIRNLITNGMKYSLDQRLTIRGERSGNHYQLIVENKAAPIPPERFAQLIDPFVVGEPSRNHRLSGTGLGLSIVQETITTLGGTFRIEQAQGIFRAYVTLPLQSTSSSRTKK